jgi:hypothetical protein
MGLHMLDNPIIGGVEAAGHDFQDKPFLIRNTHPGIGDQGNPEPITACHTVDFLLDGARVGIDKNVQQLSLLTIHTELSRDHRKPCFWRTPGESGELMFDGQRPGASNGGARQYPSRVPNGRSVFKTDRDPNFFFGYRH